MPEARRPVGPALAKTSVCPVGHRALSLLDELRKVARAVNSQPNQQSKLAAIVTSRRKPRPASPWRAFLTSERTADEEAIIHRFGS